MPLPGGPADKFGNRYETWWTVSECVRMLRGDTEAIRIEALAVEKAEFVVTTGSRRELHQVKRSHPNGKWSLAALASEGLLRTVGNALAVTDNRFVFASSSDARELAELCDAARDAESTEEFERDFLSAQRRRQSFEKLLHEWTCDVPTAIKFLQRIEVHTIDEREIENKVRLGLQVLFLTDPGKVLERLRSIVSDSVHHTISRQALVDELARRGYQTRRLLSSRQASVAVQEATDWYLNGARSKLIRQTLVPRAAAQTLLLRLGETATDNVLTGKAGSGKTACVVEITEALRKRGLPVLTFRLDRIQFPSALTTAAIGNCLGLEESPVLVLAAAAEAAGRPGVLIVDQLDAMSTMSGRSPGAFEVVERLLQEARGTRARAVIHTVVVCRAFDWQHDHRLRQLVPPDSSVQVEVTEFMDEEVKTILTNAGFDPALFRERQLELLRLPQNLSLFLEAGFDTSGAHAFGTATDLFDRYWKQKRKSVKERVASSPDQWMEVIKTLCNEMTAAQQLSVHREALDGFSPDYVDQLASEGVITFDGRRYGFGHESFFDYCFARVFFGQPESLVSFLKGSEQHLFRRTQVRQVLAYFRDAKFARYTQELRGLLSDNGIRPHIKDLTFALLAEVTSPTAEEWMIWQHWIAPALEAIEKGTPNPDKLLEMAWHRFFGSSFWFMATDQRGVIDDWLTSGNDRLNDMAIGYLRFHQRHSPDRVAALLEPYADHGGQWAQRLRFIMQWANIHTSRRFFNLFLRLVDNGTLDEARGPIAMNSTFWNMLYGLDENRPEWVPEILAHRLRRHLAIIRADDGDFRSRELLGYDHSAVEMINKSAERAPAAFVEHVLPVVLDISDSALTGDTPPKRDAVWPILIKTDHPGGEEACLLALAGALATLARECTADIRGVIPDLRHRDTYVANYLLLALYAGGASRYADEATDLLCGEPWRFQCGFSDSPHWCAREAIRAVFPHCTAENRERLETVILRYISPYERTKDGYKQTGRSCFALLSAIPPELRGIQANAHFNELERKFGEPEGEPHETTGGIVESPIEKTATDRMTDDQWLRAIKKYHSAHGIHLSGDDLKGGAWQLAGVLEERVKEDPDRFAYLSLRFPADANPVYMERTLIALSSVVAAEELKLRVCRKAFAESCEYCGRWIANVIGSIKDPLPEDAVQILHWLATEHEDPDREAWQKDAGRGQTSYGNDIETNGINTTRGSAAEAIRDLILTDAAYVDRFRQTLDLMVRDRSAAVLSCVAGTIRAVAYRDLALGMLLFRNMNLSEDRLLATRHVCDLVHARLRDNFAELRPIVERMLRSSEPKVRTVGARLASIAALIHDSATNLVDEALRGDARQRLGVAQVATANVAAQKYRDWCETTLAALFNDDDANVRRKAASCFRQLQNEPLDTYGNLIATFCDSRAFQEDSFSILHTLEKSLGRLPGTICEVCEKFLDRFANEARDIRTRHAGDAYTIVPLIFRTYQQHQNDEWTSRSLDLIDRLCLERISDIGREFEQFER